MSSLTTILRCVVLVSVVLVSVVIATPSAFAWSTTPAMGTDAVLPNMSCAFAPPSSSNGASGKAACAARGVNNSLLVNVYEFAGTGPSGQGTWSGWTSLDTKIEGDPSCAYDNNSKVYCGLRTASGTLSVVSFDGAVWRDGTHVGSTIASAPSCVAHVAGKVICVARQLDGNIAWALYDGARWGTVSTLPATVIGTPSCAADGTGRAICGMLSRASALVVNRFNGSGWDGFLDLGGVATADPTCASGASGAWCFVRSTAMSLYFKRIASTTWSVSNWGGWQTVGGSLASKPSCTGYRGPISQNWIVCMAIGYDNALKYTGYSDAVGWDAWSSIAGSWQDGVSCAVSGIYALCTTADTNFKGATFRQNP